MTYRHSENDLTDIINKAGVDTREGREDAEANRPKDTARSESYRNAYDHQRLCMEYQAIDFLSNV